MRIICSTPPKPPPPRVIVVGGGIGALAAAGRLAKAGSSVTILEKNPTLGGRVASAYLEDVRFDTGPSLLLFKDKYEEALTAMQDTDMLPIQRVSPSAYRVFYEDNTYLDILNDQSKMEAQLEAVEPGAAAAYQRFVKMAKTNLDMGVPYFIDRDFTELADAKGLQDLLPQLSSINPVDLLAPHNWVMSKFFSSQKLRALFTFQDLYVGLSPYTAPAVFSLLAGTEITDGVWYPTGGFAAVAEKFTQAAKACGVAMRTNAEVAQINVVDGSSSSSDSTSVSGGKMKVVGVTLTTGEYIEGDVVLCNRDLPAAYDLLLQDGTGSCSTSGTMAGNGNNGEEVKEYARKKSEQLAKLHYSNGVIAYNWALTTRLPTLQHHNIFLSSDYKVAWNPAASPDQLLSRPNFYVHCPARTDPTAAPEGKDSVMVLLPVANLKDLHQHMKNTGRQPNTTQTQSSNSNNNDNTTPTSSTSNNNSTSNPNSSTSINEYQELIEAGKQRILNAFKATGVGDIEPYIENELIISPPEWEQRYGLKFGAAFGLSHGLNQLSIFRPGNKDDTISGLYFVGASTRPGNGVPLALISGKLAAQRIIKEYGIVGKVGRIE